MPPPGPHDELFKASFGQPDVARSELELVLPATVREQLDLSTLVVRPGSFSDPTQRHAETDLLFSVRTRSGGEALIYVLFEHQSSFDAAMPLRLLRYTVRIWEQWRESHPQARLLPVIVPIVLHHGDAAWRAAPELTAMLDANPELRGGPAGRHRHSHVRASAAPERSRARATRLVHGRCNVDALARTRRDGKHRGRDLRRRVTDRRSAI